MMLGSFEINVLQKNAVSEEIQQIFDKATNIEGAKRELMLYLGKQEADCMNYAYISRTVPATSNPAPCYELIIVNVPYDNSNIKNYKFNATTIIEDMGKGMLGGITCSKSEEAIIRIIDSAYANELIVLFNNAIKNTKNIKEETELVKKVKEYDYDVELYLGYKPVAFGDYYYIAEVKNRKTKVKSIQLVTVNNAKEGARVVEVKEFFGSFEIDVLQKITVSEEIQQIFDKATKIEGAKRELMLYLGKKESNSVDYAYISRTVPAVLNPAPRYELIIVNVPYDNSNMKNYKFNATTIIEDMGKGMLGGIRCSSAEEATIRILNSLEADRFIRTFNSAVDNTKKIEKGTEEEMALVKKVQEYHYDVELYLGYKPVAFANYYYIAEVKNRETEVKGIQLVTVNNPKEGSIIVEIKDIL